MITEYSRNIFKNDRKPAESEKSFVVGKLYKYRNDFYAYLNVLEDQLAPRKSKENVTESIFCLTNSLAYILQTYSLWEDARHCYRSVDNALMIFELYQQQIKTLNFDFKAQRDRYISYSKEASLYQRKELAIKCAQQAYSFSTKYAQLQ